MHLYTFHLYNILLVLFLYVETVIIVHLHKKTQYTFNSSKLLVYTNSSMYSLWTKTIFLLCTPTVLIYNGELGVIKGYVLPSIFI